jgi:hypothetical protein
MLQTALCDGQLMHPGLQPVLQEWFWFSISKQTKDWAACSNQKTCSGPICAAPACDQ